MHKVNDVVIYRRDVCKIIGRQRSDFTGEPCYVLVPYANTDGTTRMQVPVANKAGNLRALMSREEIDELILEVPGLELLENKPANMKSQYAALLKGNDLHDLIRIIKTSYARNKERLEQNKKLATVDDEYLQKAEKYLFDEISASLGISFEEARVFFNEGVRRASEQH